MLPSWAGKRRDANEPEIVEALKAVGANVYRLHVPCDLLVGYRARTFLMEIKPVGERNYTEAELEFSLNWWGGSFETIDSADEALRLIGAMT